MPWAYHATRWLTAACILLFAPHVAAQQAATSADASAPEPQKPKGPPLVVIADIQPTATENAELRATLYEVARARGYDAAGTLDVEGVAARESLMQAGRISAVEGDMERLRRALDVTVLVRVSTEGRMAKLAVFLKRGVATKT